MALYGAQSGTGTTTLHSAYAHPPALTTSPRRGGSHPTLASSNPRIPPYAPAAPSQSSPAVHAINLPPPSVLAGFPPPPPPHAYPASTLTSASSSFAPPPPSHSSARPEDPRSPYDAPHSSTSAHPPPPPPPSGPLPSFGSLLSPANEYTLALSPPSSSAARRLSASEEDDSSAAEALSALANAHTRPYPQAQAPPTGGAAFTPSPPSLHAHLTGSSSASGLTRRASAVSSAWPAGAGAGEEHRVASPPESSASPSGGTTLGEGDSPGAVEGEGEAEGRAGGKGKKELKQTKRAAQNRAAQRAFRERKQQQIRDLETRASKIPLLHSQLQHLSLRCAQLEAEKHAWERERDAMRGELDALRRVVAAGDAGSS
ncbi:hypothetical protein DMC30DRAFT_444532 [Rhodotorula diobovata]|uniref:BZIP domain-containing protein n=1 Tax=Rhodotorula diobovata TaxID=5288 RepID=A0A5C5G2Y5_9BASI|nr:hypothetical protein DMC30DRAFT_444532 [Rhodotorula diobovata]